MESLTDSAPEIQRSGSGTSLAGSTRVVAAIHVRRRVVRMPGKVIVGTPKFRTGIRDVAIPPHLVSAIERHLDVHALASGEGLLFPSQAGENLSPHTLCRPCERATASGRPNLSVHDLRHPGAVLAAQAGLGVLPPANAGRAART